jgi:hypothetical protein
MLEMMMVDYTSNDLDLESYGDWNESGLSATNATDKHLDELSRNLFAPGSSPGYAFRAYFVPAWLVVSRGKST